MNRAPRWPATPLAFALLALLAPSSGVATPAHHTHHAPARPAAEPVAASVPAAAATAGAAMFVVADPRNPRIARGARGPLWHDYEPRAVGTTSMGLTFAERYLAAQRTQLAARAAKGLTTAQATKQLSKKCRRLVKITKARQVKALKKSDRRARTKCLEQRREIIAESRKDPAPTPTTPAPSTPPPGPGAPAPTTPAPTTPTPTTPAGPAPCTTPGPAALTVTAIDEGRTFELSSCGAPAGDIAFTFNSTDSDEDHNLVIADGVNAAGGPSGTVRVVSANIPGGQTRSKTFTLPAGDYVLICTVEGHGAMTAAFTVF